MEAAKHFEGPVIVVDDENFTRLTEHYPESAECFLKSSLRAVRNIMETANRVFEDNPREKPAGYRGGRLNAKDIAFPSPKKSLAGAHSRRLLRFRSSFRFSGARFR